MAYTHRQFQIPGVRRRRTYTYSYCDGLSCGNSHFYADTYNYSDADTWLRESYGPFP